LAAASARAVDFGPLAAAYDRLRPVDENWRELFDVLVAEGDLRGRRVLDVGCGTGRVTTALAELGSRSWGVDRSPEMVEEARRRTGSSARFKVADAERLPFKNGWFERALMRLVVHHVERPAAFAELHRVLAPGGRLVIATFDPAHFGGFWLNRYFPRIERIDSARFPVPADLVGELGEHGFARVRVRRLTQRDTLARDAALEKIRGRYISTLSLLDEAELAAGLERAERELPETTDLTLEWAIVVAERP
jgi:SAM-dependent methyltransferase